MKNRKLKIIIFLLCSIGICIAISIYGSYHWLKTEKINVETNKLTSQITIIQLSDIHSNIFVNENQNLITKMKSINPDIIVITGDVINSDDCFEKIAEMKKLVSAIVDIAPVYLSLGNQEVEYMKHTENDFLEQFSETGAIILEREYRDVNIKGQEVRIGGIYGYCLPEGHPSSSEEEVRFLRVFEATDSYKILLSHLPYAWVNYGYTANYNIDLIFSGHLHGGQVIIPLLGGLYNPEMGFFPGKLHGKYQENDTTIVLTSGLGSGKQKLPRFNNVPEIVVTQIIPK